MKILKVTLQRPPEPKLRRETRAEDTLFALGSNLGS